MFEKIEKIKEKEKEVIGISNTEIQSSLNKNKSVESFIEVEKECKPVFRPFPTETNHSNFIMDFDG